MDKNLLSQQLDELHVIKKQIALLTTRSDKLTKDIKATMSDNVIESFVSDTGVEAKLVTNHTKSYNMEELIKYCKRNKLTSLLVTTVDTKKLLSQVSGGFIKEEDVRGYINESTSYTLKTNKIEG